MLRGPVPIRVAAEIMTSIARAVAATHLYNDDPPPLPSRVQLEHLTIDSNDVPHLNCVDAHIDTFDGKADLPDWESTKGDVFRLARLFVELLLGEDLGEPNSPGVGHFAWLHRILLRIHDAHPVLNQTLPSSPTLAAVPGHHLTDLLSAALAQEPEDRPALDGFADELDVLSAITPGTDTMSYCSWIRSGAEGPPPSEPVEPELELL